MRSVTPLVAAAFTSGLFGGVSLDEQATLLITLTLSVAWVLGAFGTLRRHPWLQVIAGCLVAACVGWVWGAHAVDNALHAPLRTLLEHRFGGFGFDAVERRIDEPIAIEGRLIADASRSDEGIVLRLRVTRAWIHGNPQAATAGVSLSVSGEPTSDISQFLAGRLLRAPALLRRPARYLNQGLPDLERAQARRGVSLVGTIKSASLIDVVASGRWWEEVAAAVRACTRDAMARHVAPYHSQSAAMATAILIGDRAGLSADTERQLQEAGTYHVIAISGGNIAILAGALLTLLAVAGFRGRLAALVAIVTLVGYGIVAAGGPSVLRATVMAVLYLAVRLIDQRTGPMHAIAIAATGILLWNPLQVIDVGFWFTFMATAALVFAAAAIPKVPLHRMIHGSLFVLVASVCVELALAPIAAYVFQRVTVAGLLLNFAALPAMGVLQLGAMAVVASDAMALPVVATWCGFVVDRAAAVLLRSAELLDVAPWLTWRVPSPSAGVLACYYAILVATVFLWFRPAARAARFVGATCAGGLLLWIVVAPPARVRASGDGRLHVSMLDVGQGDSLVVSFPNGRRLVVDSGGLARGSFDVGERVVGPVLRASQLLALDYLAVTHADTDHVGGVAALLHDFRPYEVWWSIPVARHAPTMLVREVAQRQRASWRTLQRGDRIDIGGVEVRVLHPPPPDWERQRVRNNDSLVLELRYGRVSLLLTGDISADVERELIPLLDLAPLVALKVAHHGSLTSSSHAFLAAVRPTVALIGAGRGNTYGHPAPHVLGRLQDAGAEIFRTDLDGQIHVVTDGEAIWTSTFTGRRSHVR